MSTIAILLLGCLLWITLFFPLQREMITGRNDGTLLANQREIPIQAIQVAATPEPLVVVATPEGGLDYESAVLINIYRQVNPAVVNITALSSGDALNDILPYQFDDDELFPLGSGSGFVWDRAGHIVTNHHVVEGVNQLQVTFSDGTMAIAQVLGSDVSSDLAVLQIEPEGYTLRPLQRGSMQEIQVGMRVAAIGNPFGLAGTMTSGIVSALGRSITALNSFSIPGSIQTDAAINPGNSGGPLLNEQGQLIGVNAQIRSDVRANSGVGFAIPIAIVERVVPALIAEGSYKHSYLGVRGATLSPICAEDLQLAKSLRGAYVSQVLRGTPAARAGLRGGRGASNTKYTTICPTNRGGDIIIAIEEEPVVSFDDVLTYLEYYTSPGDTITLHVVRDAEEITLDLTLAPRPERVN